METRSLWLVRHGQASFGKADYDNLSERGHEQAYLLGKSFAERGVRPSLVVCGSMKRHRQTLAEIAAGAGWTLTKPEPDQAEEKDAKKDKKRSAADDRLEYVVDAHQPYRVPRIVDDRWNELDHTAMLTAYKPAYKNMLLLKADMVRTLRPRVAFEETFEKAVDRWTSGEHDRDYPETFPEFSQRIEQSITDVADGDEQHTIVVTSAGPVCWATAHLAAKGSIDSWKHFTLAAVNTGVTRITIDRHGPHLLSFNEFTHLDAPGIVTNR